MKMGSRWKLPLRVACALVSIVMLLFNITSWWVSDERRWNDDEVAFPIDSFAYIVLAMSIGLIVLMAVLFIIFVVFRGAQLQRKSEDAADVAAVELELQDAARRYLDEKQAVRTFAAWRAVWIAANEDGSLRGRRRSSSVDDAPVAASAVAPLGGATKAPPEAMFALPDDEAAAEVARTATALPEGWVAKTVDDGTEGSGGKAYFEHPSSGLTVWAAPSAADDANARTIVDALRDGWARHLDADHLAYYHHAPAGVTQREIPSPEQRRAAQATAAEHSAARDALALAAALPALLPADLPADLPDGFKAVRCPTTGSVYYYSEVTGETSWTLPIVLPHGWAKLTHAESGRPYYHHAASGTKQWEPPSAADEAEAAAMAATVAVADQLDKKRRSSGAYPATDAKADAKAAKVEAKRRQKAARWAWTPQKTFPIATGLLAKTGVEAHSASASSSASDVPLHLLQIYADIFADADRSGSGRLKCVSARDAPPGALCSATAPGSPVSSLALSHALRPPFSAPRTIELIHVLQKRAKGTQLASDSHVMLTLKTHLSEQSPGHEISRADFDSGITQAMRNDPDGPVAQWVLRELQDLACRWTRVDGAVAGHSGADAPPACYYVHDVHGTQTTKPALVAAIERFDAMRAKMDTANDARAAKMRQATIAKQELRSLQSIKSFTRQC